MQQNDYQFIHGDILLLDKRPDGDSVRFKPHDPALFKRLDHAGRVKIAKDGTVQLRLDAIDAPETHYEGEAQPLGKSIRGAFLKLLGFRNLHLSESGTVQLATPPTLPATILTKMIEVNGRPVSYLFIRPGLSSKQPVNAELLKQSLNAIMLQQGLAYPTFYTSTPASHRDVFAQLANDARTKKRSVWAHDTTASFRLPDQASIGPAGQLILPKLFRRCTDYLRVKAETPDLTFLQWLTIATSRGLTEDDALWVRGQRTRLSKIIKESDHRLHFQADLLDIVFIEK